MVPDVSSLSFRYAKRLFSLNSSPGRIDVISLIGFFTTKTERTRRSFTAKAAKLKTQRTQSLLRFLCVLSVFVVYIIAMDFNYSAKTLELQSRLAEFMDAHIYPNETAYLSEINSGDRWAPSQLMENLKAKAKAAGLWNWFLPELSGISNVEYAP